MLPRDCPLDEYDPARQVAEYLFSFNFHGSATMKICTWLLAVLAMTGGLLVSMPQTSHANGEKPELSSDNLHYFVHAGNCSRSIRLTAGCTCPDEATYLAAELRAKNRIVWVSTTPDTYASWFANRK